MMDTQTLEKRAPAPHASEAECHSEVAIAQKHEMLLVLVASVVATIPVWISSFPPMVDLPEHAAQVALLRNLHNPGFHFSGLFWVNWFTPYLFGYILVYALTPLFGIVAACKIVVGLAIAGLPLATAVLMKETGADCYWALLTVPAAYGFSYSWGFLIFLVAAPIGLLFLSYYIRHCRKPTPQSTVSVALLSIVLFFSHAFIYLFFGAVAGAYALFEKRKLGKVIAAVAPVAIVVPLGLVWYALRSSDAGVQQPICWDLGWITSQDPNNWGGRLTGFFPRLLGIWPQSLGRLFGVTLFALPLLAGARFSKRPSVWSPLGVCLLTIFLAPTGGHTAWFLAQRFTIFVLPFYVIGLQKPSGFRGLWRAVTVVVLFAWISVILSANVSYEAEAAGFRQILSGMEPNERALSLMFMQSTKASPAPVFVHFPAWYSAIKAGVVDMNFAVLPQSLVRYSSAAPLADPSVSEWHPQTFRWHEWRGGDYRYFVVHAPVDLGYRLFEWAPCPVSLVTQSGNWWLYEKDPHCSSE